MRSLRIAVADDESDMRDYFRKMIPRLGHELVAVAENGHDLVIQCEATKPDVVLTDLRMPVLDGVRATQIISGSQKVSIIWITAHHDHQTQRDAEASNVSGYLLKPIRMNDLAQILAKIASALFAEAEE